MLTRALIVLLLVLNLGVAAWWWLRPAPPAPSAPAQLEGVPRLRLVGEAGPRAPAASAASASASSTSTPGSSAPASSTAVPVVPPETDIGRTAITDPAAATSEPPASTPELPPQRCFAFGPYADQAAAEAARAALQPRATRLQLRSEPRPARGGNWDVVLPPQADRAAAQAMAQRIEAAGFRDYYVIGEGAAANGIALGRFGSEESARRHQAALQAAGFAVQVQGPPAAASRLWLDVAAGADFDAEAARQAASAARVQPADCDALG
ncbi:MAG TPA: SPOR domain-containing protein [Xanthomonadaceae bacterium]|nr:SPOR domain-containing protein [Xanthomonadaceae bacterium]